jgi:hypothetical protein
MVEAFLNPTQQSMQTDLQTVHAKYAGLLQYEKNITEEAIETCKQLKAQVDAAQDAKAMAEAELAGVKSENEQLKEQVITITDKARVEVDELKKEREELLLHRARMRKARIFSFTSTVDRISEKAPAGKRRGRKKAGTTLGKQKTARAARISIMRAVSRLEELAKMIVAIRADIQDRLSNVEELLADILAGLAAIEEAEKE